MKRNIQIAWREWAQCKEAMFWATVYIVGKAVAIFLNARILLLLGSTFDDMDRIQEHLIRLGVLCLIQIGMEILISATFVGKHAMYTSASSRYTKRLLDADYDMYTKYSCSGIVTSTQRLWGIANIGRDVSDIAVESVNVAVIFYSIYQVFPNLIPPVMLIYSIAIILTWKLFKAYGKIDTAVDKMKRKRNQEIDEVINGFAEVRSFCTEAHHQESIVNQNNSILGILRNRNVISIKINCGITLIDGGGTLITAWLAARQVIAGNLTPALAITLVMFVWRLMDPLVNMLNQIDSISEKISALDDFAKVLEYENQTVEGNLTIDQFTDKIELKDVGFAYGIPLMKSSLESI